MGITLGLYSIHFQVMRTIYESICLRCYYICFCLCVFYLLLLLSLLFIIIYVLLALSPSLSLLLSIIFVSVICLLLIYPGQRKVNQLAFPNRIVARVPSKRSHSFFFVSSASAPPSRFCAPQAPCARYFHGSPLASGPRACGTAA